jgi:hypothetical protein
MIRFFLWCRRPEISDFCCGFAPADLTDLTDMGICSIAVRIAAGITCTMHILQRDNNTVDQVKN